MKILYFSDGYSWNVMGVKRSISEELQRRGHNVIYLDKGLVSKIADLIFEYDPDQIWLAHTGLSFSDEVRKKIKKPIIGFGFSDPYYVQMYPEKYDVYITNHYRTYLSLKDKMKCIYNPPSCDFKFHQKLDLQKTIDLLMIGTAVHSRFKNRKLRIEAVNKLRSDTSWIITTYGRKWPKNIRNKGHIEGQEFLVAINSARLGLDPVEKRFILTRRIFEFSACGVPIITKHREEPLLHFEKDKEILTYNNYNDLLEQVNYYLSNPSELEQIGTNALERCVRDHNISNRVDHILTEL